MVFNLKYIVCFILLFLCSAQILLSQNVNTSKYSNEFLNLGIGARAIGMGNTQVAVVGDVTSGYWNPAGLAYLSNKYDIAAMHNEYFAGIAKFDYLGFATKLDTGTVLAFSYVRYGIDNIPDTRFLFDSDGNTNNNIYGPVDYSKIRYFSATDNAFLLSFAKKSKLIKGLSTGGNFKIIYRNVGQFANAWGFGLDAGMQYKINNLQIGCVLRDATSTYNFWTVNSSLLQSAYATFNTIDSTKTNTIPENSIELTLPRLILGAARYVKLNKNDQVGVLASVDLDFTFDGKRNVLFKSNLTSIDPRAGIELNYKRLAFLRMGINNIQEVKNFDGSKQRTFQPNFGVGVKLKSLLIDYALVNPTQSTGLVSHVFSLRLSLEKF